MLYEVLIPAPVLMIPILIMTTKGTHSPKNDSGLPSDVIVTYSNHAEASHDDKIVVTPKTTTTGTSSGTAKPTAVLNDKSVEFVKKNREKLKIPLKEIIEEEEPFQEDVVFIPNEREISQVRNEYHLQKDHASLSELMAGHRTVGDLLAGDVRLETESPMPDTFFVTGKNHDAVDRREKERQEKMWHRDIIKGEPTTKAPKLNCTNLNCNNAIKSVCGEKIDDHDQRRVRLFMNDCYFRKVNCNFKSPSNMYRMVALEQCQNLGAHTQPPFSFSFKSARKVGSKQVQLNNTRRSSSSRRSMSMNVHGQFCSHACPVSCPEQYEPECAVSSTGRRRVFVNHCALDHNSCSFGVVWHSVPLAECVGGKKADLRQNAGFIGWMQRVGIVDKRGRLAYDAQ